MCKCSGQCGCNITSTTKGEKGDASTVASLGYKVYTALLTQTGTNAPVATVLQNTVGSIAWTYTAVGIYTGTLAAAFPSSKTSVLCNASNDTGGVQFIGIGNFTVNTILVTSSDSTTSPATPANDTLLDTFIEIRVYP